MNIFVDPINSPEEWRAYVEDIKKDKEKVLFFEDKNLDGIKDPIAYLRDLSTLIDRPAARLFVGLTLTWPPHENPSVRQMCDTMDYILEYASGRCTVTTSVGAMVSARLDEQPLLRGGHINTGHAHMHAALFLVHPDYRSLIDLNRGWDVKLFEDATREAEEKLHWSRDTDAPRYTRVGNLVRVKEQEASFKLTQAQRRMEMLYGECAKRRLRRQLRDIKPDWGWEVFNQKLRSEYEAAYFRDKRGRWVFKQNTEIVPAKEVGPQWDFSHLERVWGPCRIFRELGLTPIEQLNRQKQRLRIESRLPPDIVESMQRPFPNDIGNEIRDFCSKLQADMYRVTTQDAEHNITRLDPILGSTLFTDRQAQQWRDLTFEGKTVYIVPEKWGFLPLLVPCSSRRGQLVPDGYTPAAFLETEPGQYQALLWAECIGDPDQNYEDRAKNYNAGKRLLRNFARLTAPQAICFPYPHQPAPCPGLHQAASTGQKCSAFLVTGKTCAKASTMLRQSLVEFEQEEAKWRQGALGVAAEHLERIGPNAHPAISIYRAHVRDLLRTARIRCHTMDEIDTRIAVRLLRHWPPERVEAVLAMVAPLLPRPAIRNPQQHAATIASEAQMMRSEPGMDSDLNAKSWQAVTGAVVSEQAIQAWQEEEERKKKRKPSHDWQRTAEKQCPVAPAQTRPVKNMSEKDTEPPNPEPGLSR